MKLPPCVLPLLLPAAWGLLLSGCAILGGNLPPGTAAGSFVVNPDGLPRLSANMRARRDALDTAERVRVEQHFQLLQELIGSSAALREQVQKSQRRIEASYLEDRRVSALDLEVVREGAQWFIELDLLLYNLFTSWRAYLPYASEPDPYAPVRGATLLDRETRIKGGLVALVAEVVRLDNARIVMDMLEGQWAITRFLNAGDPERGIAPESFDRLVGAYFDPGRRELLQGQLLALTDAEARKRLDELAARDGEVATLLARLGESIVARELVEESAAGRQLRFAMAVMARSGVALLTPILNVYIAAVVRDDAIDRSTLRRLSSAPGVADDVVDTLAPMDILLLRDVTRARPGATPAYTHAVVYLGDYARLKDAPASDSLGFSMNRARLRRGRVFVDASARGIELTELDDLLDAQDVAVLRLSSDEEARDDAQRAALGALVSKTFRTPSKLSQRAHSARLLVHVFGPALTAREGPGRQAPPLSIIIADALENPEVRVVYSTLDGSAQPARKREDAVRERLERQGPLDVMSPTINGDESPEGD